MNVCYFGDNGHAQLYSKARPGYCDEIFDTIFKYCEQGSNRFKLAVDVGCGTGHHSTRPLTARFEHVIGTDLSEGQLQVAAKDIPNVEFIHSPAENLTFLKPETVDLVTAGTAFHWFDIPKFFEAVDRVLMPGGTVAVYGYDFPTLLEPDGQAILQQFITSYINPYEAERIRWHQSPYDTAVLPFGDCSKQVIESPKEWTVDDLCEFFRSTSHWQRRIKDVPGCETLKKLHNRLLEFHRSKTGLSSPKITVLFVIELMMGRKQRQDEQIRPSPK